MLSGVSQRRALPRYQSRNMKILNISGPQMRIEHTTSRVYNRTLVPRRYHLKSIQLIIKLTKNRQKKSAKNKNKLKYFNISYRFSNVFKCYDGMRQPDIRKVIIKFPLSLQNLRAERTHVTRVSRG